MAKVITSDQVIVSEPWWVKIKIVWLGIGAGVSWFILATLLNKYVVDPLACRNLATVADVCVNSFGTAGSIATVLVAAAMTYFLVRNLQPRPIIVALATLLLLWDLGTFLNGLSWWVALLASIGLYAACYSLFALVGRLRTLWTSALLALFIVVAIRLIIQL